MSTSLLKTIADFDTQLATAASVGATTATLVSATDDDGVALPTGTYGLTIDAGNSSKEYIICTLTSTALTNILNITRQGTTSSGFARTHRRGAKVTITDWAILKRILNNIDGTTGFDSASPLSYDGNPTFTADGQIITKKYADDLAIAGSPDMSTTVKGIAEEATAAEINAGTQTGGTAAELAVNPKYLKDSQYYTLRPDQIANNTDIAVGSGNKVVTQTGLQKGAEVYAASTTGNDTYVVTLSPVPTSLVNGMTIRFKPDTANTGAATLNVNSLGALAIVTGLSTALVTGDILANQICVVVYNSTGTVWQLLNPASAYLFAPIYKNGATTHSSASDTQTITHSLGRIPKRILINTSGGAGSQASFNAGSSNGFWDANGQSCTFIGNDGTNHQVGNSTTQACVARYFATNAKDETGIIGNVTATTFDIVWTSTGNTGGTTNISWSVEA